MDFSAFADWDWTSHAAGENEESGADQEKGFAASQISGLLFLVDCNPSMFVKKETDGSNFDKCIRCIKSVCQRKVVSNQNDMIAVVFYGLDKSSMDDGKAIYVYQDIGQLNIKKITDLEDILKDSTKFVTDIGHSQNYDMSDVFWACSNVFGKSNKSFGEKKILLFTDNDNPHSGDIKLERKAAAKATDLKAVGIELELLSMARTGDGFNMQKFYASVLYDDSGSDFPEPSEKFEELLSRVYRKEHKRRALGRIPLKIGKSVELSVGVYSLCRRSTLPTSVKIHRTSNSEVKTQTRVFNKETGDDVMPQDIKLFQEHGGKRICLNPEEISRVKDLDISGLKVIGFKKVSDLKLHLHVKPSHFIYPDETNVKGSTRLFSALLNRCLARGMAPVCWYKPRANSPLELVYLLPQTEEKGDSNEQITPPGFHVVFVPFKEDMRELDVHKEAPSATAEQVDKCKMLVKKLSFPYNPMLFDNPALQTFYANLEAMALNKDEPEEVTDYTVPAIGKIDTKAGNEVEAFRDSVFPEGYSLPTGVKRAASSTSKAASKKPKQEISDIDAKVLAASGKLNTLTVSELKDVLKRECIKTSATKKADIIEAIESHYAV